MTTLPLDWQLQIVSQAIKENPDITLAEYSELVNDLQSIHEQANKEVITEILMTKKESK